MNRLLLIAALTGAIGLAGGTAEAAPAGPPPPVVEKQEKEPAHRVLLLGATIFGTVAAPSATYDMPWQEPFLLGRGASELDRNFLKEIFRPIDREEFLKTAPTPLRERPADGR